MNTTSIASRFVLSLTAATAVPAQNLLRHLGLGDAWAALTAAWLRCCSISSAVALVVVATSLPISAQGKIVVCNDEWTLSDAGFTAAPASARNLALNTAAWFTCGQPGNFLCYSVNPALVGASLSSTMTGAGHTWSCDTSVTFNLATLLTYNGVFLGGPVTGGGGPPIPAVMISYVQQGGCVYLAAGAGGFGSNTAAEEAAAWNPFLNAFCLQIANVWNTLNTPPTPITCSPSHPVLTGVTSLLFRIGSDVSIVGSCCGTSVCDTYFGFHGPSCEPANLMSHNDGLQEGFSRGPGKLTDTLTVIQRIPEEQWCGRQCLECVTVEFRDLTPGTPEPFSIELRKGTGSANSPTDAPNMTATGLLAPPFFRVKPAGPARVLMTIDLDCCVPLPPGTDTYICVVLPPPGDLRVWFSANEVHRGALPTTCVPLPGRYRGWPDLGLSWVFDPIGLPPLKTTNTWNPGGGGTDNYSWAIGASLREDVCQAFGSGPAIVPPNYGYVGIYPDLGRAPPDKVGFRLRSSHPPGSPCVLLLGLYKGPPFPFDLSSFPLWSGFLCFDPIVMANGLTGPGSGPCISTSEAVVGPFIMPPNLCGLDFCAQFASIDPIPGTVRASTACLVDM